MSAPGRIVVFGDVIDDIVVRPHGPVRPDTDTSASIRHRPGGSAANVAAWLGTIVVLIDEDNRRTMLTERGANTRLVPADISDDTLAGAAALYLTGYSVFSGSANPEASPAAFQELIARCARRRIPVVVDPSSAGYLEDFGPDRFLAAIAGASVLLPNLDEGRALTERFEPMDVTARLAENFPVVALTRGWDGTVVAGSGSAPATRPPWRPGRSWPAGRSGSSAVAPADGRPRGGLRVL